MFQSSEASADIKVVGSNTTAGTNHIVQISFPPEWRLPLTEFQLCYGEYHIYRRGPLHASGPVTDVYEAGDHTGNIKSNVFHALGTPVNPRVQCHLETTARNKRIRVTFFDLPVDSLLRPARFCFGEFGDGHRYEFQNDAPVSDSLRKGSTGYKLSAHAPICLLLTDIE